MTEITTGDELHLIGYRELAAMLNCSTAHARKLVASGDIPLVKLSPKAHRVRLSDVKRFIAAGGTRSDV